MSENQILPATQYHVIYTSPADGKLHGGEYTQQQLIELLQGGAVIDCATRVKTDKLRKGATADAIR